jgi:hypothetical protein
LINAFTRHLYLALIKGSWTKDEIYAVFGAPVPATGGGRGTVPGNLSKLSPPSSGGRGGN